MEASATRKNPRPGQKAVISASTLRKELNQVASVDEAYRKFQLAPGYKFYVDRNTNKVFAGKINPQNINAMRRVEAAQERLIQMRNERRERDRERYQQRVQARREREAQAVPVPGALEGRRKMRTKEVTVEAVYYARKYEGNDTRSGSIVHMPMHSYMNGDPPSHHDEYVALKTIKLVARKDKYFQLIQPYSFQSDADWLVLINNNRAAYERYVEGIDVLEEFCNVLSSAGCFVEIRFESEAQLAMLPPAEQRMFAYDRKAMLCSRFTYPQIADGHSLIDVLKAQNWSDFVEENSRPLSCLFDVIIDTYKSNIEASDRAKNWLRKHALTYDGLIPERNGGPLMLPEAVDNFFRPLRLGLCVFDIFGKSLYGYHPDLDGKDLNRNIAPSVLYLLAHENHVWLARNCCSLAQRMKWDKDTKSFGGLLYDIPISSFFPKIDQRLGTYADCTLLHSAEELPLIIHDFAKSNNPTLRMFYAEPCLANLLNDLVTKMNLMPMVTVKSQAITSIKIIFDANENTSLRKTTKQENEKSVQRLLTIESYNSQAAETHNSTIQLNTNEQLRTYLQYRDELNSVIMSGNHKSYYGPGVMEAFKAYPRKALLGNMEEGDAYEIDFRRYYTSILESMEGLPVLNQFDVFRPYNQEEAIDPYSFYIVQCNRDINERYPFVYDRERCLVRGSTLLKYTGPRVEAVLRPSKIVKPGDAIKDVIKRLYETDLPDSVKKGIPNTVTGMIEKMRNKKQHTYLFKDEAFAMDAKLRLQEGTRLHLSENVHALIVSRERELVNGFYPIKRYIYEEARVRMQDLYDSLQLYGIRIMGVRTDAVYVNINKRKLIEEWMKNEPHWFGPDRGRLAVKFNVIKKIEITELNQCKIPLDYDDKPKGVISIVPRAVHTIQNEWDQSEFNAYFDEHKKPVLLTANLPGSGKSVCIQQYLDARGMKALYVCSDNALISELQKDKRDAVTINRFFGFGVTDEQNMNAVDYSQYDTIVFEEIYKNGTAVLGRIQQFIADHPELRIFANGDPRQNLPIECINHIPEAAPYYDTCMDMIFRNSIHLHHMKSMTDPADRVMIATIYKDLFENKMSVKDVVKKYFYESRIQWNDIPIDAMNVVYLNETADLVNGMIQTKKGASMAWKVGDLAVCRGHVEVKTNRPVKNELYRITDLSKDTFTVCSTVSGKIIDLSLRWLNQAFKRSYAATGHSLQGRRFDTTLVIHDWSHFLITPEWLWTAITRARSLKQILFCADSKGRYDYINHIQQKVKGYKEQDARFGSNISGYVDATWIRQKLRDSRMCCYHCHAFIAERWVLDRLDANLPHTQMNCVLACETCNWSKARSERKS